MDRGAGFNLRLAFVFLPIGSKDLPMPEKTHLRRAHTALAELAFVLLRRPIPKRGMQP